MGFFPIAVILVLILADSFVVARKLVKQGYSFLMARFVLALLVCTQFLIALVLITKTSSQSFSLGEILVYAGLIGIVTFLASYGRGFDLLKHDLKLEDARNDLKIMQKNWKDLSLVIFSLVVLPLLLFLLIYFLLYLLQ